MKCFIWTDEVSYTAFAHCENITEARRLLRDEIGGYDGSCPEREKARKTMEEFTPSIYVGRIAGFRLSDSAEVRELEKYQEKLTTERDQLRAEVDRLRGELSDALAASGANAKAWQDAVCDEAVKRSQLLAEIGLTEQQRDAATARAEAAEKELAEIRESLRSRHAAPLTGQTVAAAVRCALDNGDSHYTALRSRAEAAEALVAGLRGALEEIAAHGLGMSVVWAKAALALTPASAGARLKAEALRSLQADDTFTECTGTREGHEAIQRALAVRIAEAEKEAANGR